MTSFVRNSVDALIVHFPKSEIVIYTTSDMGTDKLSTNAYPLSATSWLKKSLDGASANCGHYRQKRERKQA
jgi:hypothetical protein